MWAYGGGGEERSIKEERRKRASYFEVRLDSRQPYPYEAQEVSAPLLPSLVNESFFLSTNPVLTLAHFLPSWLAFQPCCPLFPIATHFFLRCSLFSVAAPQVVSFFPPHASLCLCSTALSAGEPSLAHFPFMS